MNMAISENTDIRTVQTLIDEAKSLGLRVVHRPDQDKSNVISMDDHRIMMAHISPEAA